MILFVCVHNAGRSQMAEALFNRAAEKQGATWRAVSAGTAPAGEIDRTAVAVMQEIGIDISGSKPKKLTLDRAAVAARIVTMGCGVDAEACPAGFLPTEDWGLADPAGRPIEEVRAIRDEIERRVVKLLAELGEEY